MTRDGEAYGGGPLRRGNTTPPETPDLVEHVPLSPEDDDDWPTMPGYAVRPAQPAQPSAPPTPPAQPSAPVNPAPPVPTSGATTPASSAPTSTPTPPTPSTPSTPAPTPPAPMPSSAPVVPTLPGGAPAAPTTRAAAAAAAAAHRPVPPAQSAPLGHPGQAASPDAPATVPTTAAIPGVPTVPAAPTAPAPTPTPPAPAPSAQAPSAQAPSAPGLVQSVPLSPAPAASAPAASAPASPAHPAASAPAGPSPTVPPQPAAPHAPATPAGPGPDHAVATRREQREAGVERRSFLQQDPREDPARRGGRGFLNRIGFSLGPNASERASRDDEHAVSRHWPGPRTVAVVNGKGGAGKTPATVLLSAVFAQYGGAGVLAWDNNQTRGTLGWRTETGAHDRTLLELLPQTQRLLGAQGQSADLAHFVHHQPQEKYDVLRSKPIRLAHENRLSPADVDAIHAVAAKFYRLIIIDSGNDESDPMWLRMIDRADQLVVATTTRDDHAEAGALLLEALEDRDERSAHLARQAVVVVSQADPKASSVEVGEVVAGYEPLAREVVRIPYDREMVDGHLRLRALASPTQEAWLSAAAAVARGF
ncbi:MinD/ParA family ATP-binding protein [Microbacterium maritypicum]